HPQQRPHPSLRFRTPGLDGERRRHPHSRRRRPSLQRQHLGRLRRPGHRRAPRPPWRKPTLFHPPPGRPQPLVHSSHTPKNEPNCKIFETATTQEKKGNVKPPELPTPADGPHRGPSWRVLCVFALATTTACRFDFMLEPRPCSGQSCDTTST